MKDSYTTLPVVSHSPNGASIEDPAGRRAEPDHRPVSRDVKKALAYIRNNLEQKIAMADLVAAGGTKARTLRTNFAHFVGISPVAYLRWVRLAAARQELINPAHDTSVTGVAARFRFTHLSRFATDYQRRFKELPSLTLQRGRSEPVDGDTPKRPNGETHDFSSLYLARSLPSLVIHRFQTSLGDYESSAFADSLTEQTAASLSHAHSLTVALVGPAPTKAPHGRTEQRYCLVGRVVRGGTRMRVIVRLIDAEDNRQLWGDSYDGSVPGLLALGDRVVDGVSHAVHSHILADQIDRARNKSPDVLTARDISLRVLPAVIQRNNAARVLHVLHLAMELDPDAALPAALAGWCHAQLASPWNPDAAAELAQARFLSRRAEMLDLGDPLILAVRTAITHYTNDYVGAEALAVRALAKDPGQALAWLRLGNARSTIRTVPPAVPGAFPISCFERVGRLGARYLDGADSYFGIGTVHLGHGRYREAEPFLRKGELIRPGMPDNLARLACCYLRLGDDAAGRRATEAAQRNLPDVTATQFVDSIPTDHEDYKEKLASGLIAYGMPA